MSFSIDSVHTAIKEKKIIIKNDEWITHALMRFINDGKDNNQTIWKLNAAFKKLNKDNQKEIIALAREIEQNAPFAKREKDGKGYKITKSNDVLSLEKNPVNTSVVIKKDQNIEKKDNTPAPVIHSPVIPITPIDRAIIEKDNNTNIAPVKNIPAIPPVIVSPLIESKTKTQTPPIAPKTQPLPRDPNIVIEEII